jgi:hypothetical protein
MFRYGTFFIALFIALSLFFTGCGGADPVVPSIIPTTTYTTAIPSVVIPAIKTPTTTPTAIIPSIQPTNTFGKPTATVPPDSSFKASSPIAKFTSEDIAFLGVYFSGTQEQIADGIKQWQEDNWTYAAGLIEYPNASDPIRWNYFLPGIFSSRDIIHEQVKNNKNYGVCFSYAITYCSIAEYYGLEVRVLNSKSKPSDNNPDIGFTAGMSPDEYDRLKVKLDKAGLKYDYEAIRLVAEETPGHYWAEVKINGQWVIKDATEKATGGNTAQNFIAANDFQVTDWLNRDKSKVLDDYQARLNRGERLPEQPRDTTIPNVTTPADYIGMTDDLGQIHRAASIDDAMQGLALVPYFDNVSVAFDFIRATGISAAMINTEQQLKTTYEQISGKKMYVVALLMNQDIEGQALADAYLRLCGEELDLQVYEQLLSQSGM